MVKQVAFLLAGTATLALSSPASAQTETPPTVADAPSAIATPTQTDTETPARKPEDIVVTGSYIRSQASRVSPVQIVDAAALSAQGNFNPDSLVANLTVNSGAQITTDPGGRPFSIGTSNVNLRGLGVSSTLTLLNGHRQVLSAAADPNGGQFVDLNSLVPTIAIERAEVLKDGASSLYGSDAVAGVVNFITYKKFNGVRVQGNLAMTTREGQSDGTIGILAGKSIGRLDVVAAFSYFSRTGLLADKRNFRLRSSTSNFGFPSTYLVGGVYRPDPSCASVAASNPRVIAPAGGTGYCVYDFGNSFSLVPTEKRKIGSLDARYALTDTIQAYGSFGIAYNSIRSSASSAEPFLTPPTLPASNPGNVFGVPVTYFGRPLGTDSPNSVVRNESHTWRATGGVKGDIGSTGFHFDASYTHAYNSYSLDYPDTIKSRFIAALNGVGGPNNNEYFNPLYGASNDPAVIDDFIGSYAFIAKSKLDVADAVVSGDLFNLPGGPVGIAVGGQYRHNSLAIDYNQTANNYDLGFFQGNTDFSGKQNVGAGFVEVSAPILATVTLTGAVRYENFGHGVDTVNPKAAVLFRPTEWLSLRGTYGTSFRAPSIYETSGTLVQTARVLDPISGRQSSIAQQTTADPNSTLKPQKADTYDAGATLRFAGVNLSFDYWRFKYRNYITPENAAAVVAADPTGPQVRRAGTTLTGVTTFFRNAASLFTDGLDVQLTYHLPTRIGTFSLDGNATRVLSYDLDDPIRGKIKGLGNRNSTTFGVPAPKWRTNVGVLWEKGRFGANAYYRYIDGYADDNNKNTHIHSFQTVDAQLSLRVPALMVGGPENKLAIGAKNLFDKDAPDALYRLGYDPLISNPLGRIFYASFEANF